jgi:hypothetical protein
MRNFGSVASRRICVGGRVVQSAWDTYASHTFISTRLAAELISKGAQWRKCELPIKQGIIPAGASRVKVLATIDIVHRGRVLHLTDETCWVWDMGTDITLCNALLEDEGLLPSSMGDADDTMLAAFETCSGPFKAGEGESLLLSHLQSRSNYCHTAIVDVASLNSVAQAGPPLPADMSDASNHEDAVTQFARSVAQQTSQARVDAWSLSTILEARKLLIKQMNDPDVDCRRRLEEIKVRYPEAFGDTIYEPCRLRKFEILLKPGFKYYCFLPRRASEPVIAEMKKQISALLEQGVIEHCSDSPFAFPIVMARRPNSDKLRLCVDYKLQNDQTIPCPFPVPNLREQLDNLAGKKYYCSLDCSQFFHQFELTESSRYLTAFVVPWGEKFQWKRAPFGLRNCPAHCQQEFSQLLLKSGIRCLQDIQPYLDDVAFGADSVDELCEKFEELCKLAVQTGLRFKESKCVLGATAIQHLGFVVNSDGIHIAPSRIDSLLKLPAAKNVDDIRHILGTFVFCREWLTDMTTMTAPLTDLLKKGAQWEWGPAQERALRLLKESVVNGDCLQGAIDPTRKVFARSDSSILGVACVIFQLFPDATGQMKPRAIAYSSRRYSPTEFKWCLNEKEAYSIKFIFEKFGDLLRGHEVECQTDHRNSLWIQQSKSPKVIRWRLFLNQWTHSIAHLPGRENQVADGLSRVQEMSDDELDQLIQRLHVSKLFECAPSESIRIGEPDDESTDSDIDSAMFNGVLQEALHELQTREDAPTAPHVAAVATLSNVLAADKLTDPVENSSTPTWTDLGVEGAVALLNPVSANLLQLIKSVHSDTSGHVGALRTYRRLRLLPDLPNDMTYSDLMRECADFVRACPTCQKLSRLPSPWKDAHFRWIRAPPFREISIDVLEMPYADLDGNLKTFVAIDSFTRALELFPLPSADAPRVAEALYAIYCRFGRFSTVRCDGAKAFIGSVMPMLLKLLGSSCHQIHAYAHWENGQVERSHKEVLRHLKPLILFDRAGANSQKRWNTLLNGARRILMNTVNASTGVAPNTLIYGGFADREEEMFMCSPDKVCAAEDIPEFVSELEFEQSALLQRAFEHQQREFARISDRMAESPDPPLIAGAWVLANRQGMPHGRPVDKFQFGRTGPWRVLDRPDPGHPVVECVHAADGRVVAFHRHELVPFNCELLDSPEEYAFYAQRDFWDYSIDHISSHRPLLPRKQRGRRTRAKGDYDFLVHYKFLPVSEEPGCENPSWQPYAPLRETSALQEYCDRPDVKVQLGDDFLTPDS